MKAWVNGPFTAAFFAGGAPGALDWDGGCGSEPFTALPFP